MSKTQNYKTLLKNVKVPKNWNDIICPGRRFNILKTSVIPNFQ